MDRFANLIWSVVVIGLFSIFMAVLGFDISVDAVSISIAIIVAGCMAYGSD